MGYLIGQIIVCLIIAALLGALIAWWLRGSAAKRREAILQENIRLGESKISSYEDELKKDKLQFGETQDKLADISARCVSLEKTIVGRDDDLNVYRREIIDLNGLMDKKAQRITSLEKESRNWQEKIPPLETVIGTKDSTIFNLKSSIGDFETKIPLLEGDLKSRDGQLLGLRKNINDLELSLQLNVDDRDKKLRSIDVLLASQISKTKSALQAKSDVEKTLDGISTELSVEQNSLRSRIDTLEGELAVSLKQCDDSEATLSDLHKKFDEKLNIAKQSFNAETELAKATAQQGQQELEALRAKLTECQAARDVAAKESTPSVLQFADDAPTEKKMFSSRPAKVDDLKRISGIGPKLEVMLHDLGVYQFSQIERFNHSDLDWIDDHLDVFKGRAKRDNWIGQAGDLAAE